MLAKRSLAKNILESIMFGGGISCAVSRSFMAGVLPALAKCTSFEIKSPKDKKKVYDTFYRLKNQGMIRFETIGKQLHISLTEEGKRRVGKNKIDDLEIKKPKRWDNLWRILIFDIQSKDKLKREALRGKIKDLGLYQLQKSVWVYPYNFAKEGEILRSFFDLTKDEMKIITASHIEDDRKIRIYFKMA